MKKGVYTIEVYKESLEACGATIEQIVDFIAARANPNGCEYILHNRTPNVKEHYHVDFGWDRACPDLSEFLNVCDACNKYYRKRSLTPSSDKSCSYIKPINFVDPKFGAKCREVHVVKGVKGRYKYLLHISDSCKRAGKEEYKPEELFQSVNWDENKYTVNSNTIRKQKLADKYEQDEAEHGDPFLFIFTMIRDLNICNLPQLINVVISSEKYMWCLPYVKNDLLKYNAIIRDFAAIQRREYAEASMRADKSNNTECCQNMELKQELQMGTLEEELEHDPFDEEFEEFSEEDVKEIDDIVEEPQTIEFVDSLDG